jgi:hypothetical protein
LGGTLDVLDPTGQPASIPVNNQVLIGTPDVYLMPRLTCNPAATTGSHQYVNGACFSLPSAPGVNGPYREPYMHGPAYTDSDLAVQKSFKVAEGKAIFFRFSAFNFINHANTTFTSAVQPNNITLNFNNNAVGAAQPVNNALADAANTNAAVFGSAPLRTGRRVSEVELKFAF